MQKLFVYKGIQCQYLTFMGINKLQKCQSTKMFVTVQKLFGFDTPVLILNEMRDSFSKHCITA